jgi:homoserine kinase
MIIPVTVPGTLSNLGSGFDVAGMAVDVYNQFVFNAEPPGEGLLVDQRPPAADDAVISAMLAAEASFGGRMPKNLHISTAVQVPRRRGLGSSATARVAGTIAYLQLNQIEASVERVLAFLAELEGHPDNAAPALLGGFCVARAAASGVTARSFRPPAELAVALCIPSVEVSTDDARRVLPEAPSRADAVFALGHFGTLVAGLLTGDEAAIGEGLHDRLHEPWRKPLIGPVDEAFSAARREGAAGAFISGSGSTLAAFVLGGRVNPQRIADVMRVVFKEHGIKAEARVVRPVPLGAWAISRAFS